MTEPSANHDLLYGIDHEPPLAETAVLGLQHYLTMFGSTVAIPLMLAAPLGITDPVDVGKLIATMFFVSGITTILQSTWGNRLPIVQGRYVFLFGTHFCHLWNGILGRCWMGSPYATCSRSYHSRCYF